MLPLKPPTSRIQSNKQTKISTDDPTTYKEAISRPDAALWIKAMQAEIDSLTLAGTYDVTELPQGFQAIGGKWVFRTKRGANGEIVKYKARWVAQGFRQKHGIDYNETFAPVARFDSIRAVLALVAHHDWELHQMDVKSAYLNGDLEEELYMRQPTGFVVKGSENLVCRLNKSLYGLKQVGRTWNKRIDVELKAHINLSSFSEQIKKKKKKKKTEQNCLLTWQSAAQSLKVSHITGEERNMARRS